MKKFLGIICAVNLMIAVAFSGPASATLLGVNLGLPDVTSNSIGAYDFDAQLGLFTSIAIPESITYDGSTKLGLSSPGSPLPVYLGTYSLGIILDNSGNFISGISGSDLVITGDLDFDGTVETLIIGEVNNFGWEANAYGGIDFDFTFVITGGLLAADFGGIGFSGGDICNSESGNFVDWNTDHDGAGAKHDTAPVPEPATMLLLGSGLIGMLGYKKRKSL